jgi:hypothetical protein
VSELDDWTIPAQIERGIMELMHKVEDQVITEVSTRTANRLRCLIRDTQLARGYPCGVFYQDIAITITPHFLFCGSPIIIDPRLPDDQFRQTLVELYVPKP